MPWKECLVMDERLQFVACGITGEPKAELCRSLASPSARELHSERQA